MSFLFFTVNCCCQAWELRFSLYNDINFHSRCTFDSFLNLTKHVDAKHKARALTQTRSQ